MAIYTRENCAGRSPIVFLDGREVDAVEYADDDLGYVVVAVKDESGKIVLDGDHIKREVLSGVVSVVFPAPQQGQ